MKCRRKLPHLAKIACTLLGLMGANSVPGICYADDPPSDSDWLTTAWDDFKSPITTKSRYVLLGGTGLAATLSLFEDQISDPVQAETTEDHPLGSFSKIGDISGRGLPNALYFVGALSYGAPMRRRLSSVTAE